LWHMTQNAEATSVYPHPGLVGWWRFDEGTGIVAKDSSGSGNHGTVYGTAAWVDGKYGKALSFDGVNDYVGTTSMSLNLLTSAFTFEAWIKPLYVAPNPGYASLPIVAKFASIGFSVAPLDVNVFHIKAWANGAANTYNSGKAWGSWHYIAIVYTGFGSSQRKIYVDGSLVGTDTSGTAADFSGIVKIGDSSWYVAKPFSIIDEVRIYNRALSAAEIQADFQESPDFSSKLLAKVPKGTTQVITTLSWQGVGSLNVTIQSPSKNYTEDLVPVYQKTVYSTSDGTSSMLNIKRLSVSTTALATDENWYVILKVDQVDDYRITVEVQK